jgi:hypothetical protein
LALSKDKVVIGSSKLFLLDATTGNIIWTYNVTVEGLHFEYAWSSPVIAEGHIFVASGNGRLYAFGDPFEYDIMLITIGIVMAMTIIISYKFREKDAKAKGGK